MNTSLAIPTKIQNTAPKPTKSQLTEALIQRARAAHSESEAIKKIKREALEAEGIALVLEAIKKTKFTEENVQFYFCWGDADPLVSCNITSPKIKSIQAKMTKLSSSHFDEDATKAKIREGLKAPNPLLDNNEITKSLDQLLATIMGQPKLKVVDV